MNRSLRPAPSRLPTGPPFALDLDEEVLRISEADVLTHRHLMEHVFTFGATGSGKSSGVARLLAKTLLKYNYGILILCGKSDEAQTWLRWAEESGRGDDVRRFAVDQPQHSVNLLQYAYAGIGGRGKGVAANVVDLLLKLLEQKFKSSGGGSGDSQFFVSSAGHLLTNAVILLAAAKEMLSFDAIGRLIGSAPMSLEEVADPEFRNSYVSQTLDKIAARPDLTAAEQNDVKVAVDYWLKDFPDMDDRTRSNVVATVQSVIWPFRTGPVSSLVGGSKTTLSPQDVLDGKVVLLDVPPKQFFDAGWFAQLGFKILFQRTVEARGEVVGRRPVALFVDEAQLFLTSADVPFLSTSRSALCCNVWLTQNVSGLKAMFPAGTAEAEASSLLGNFSTLVFCSNSNVETNKFAAETIGHEWVTIHNSSVSLAGQEGMSSSSSDRRQYKVEPSAFARLKKGGADKQVEAIVYRGGTPFHNGQNYLPVIFHQG